MMLLRDFTTSRSEPAFAALVQRHVGLVHSAALRQVSDAHLAEEIAQAVFIILARKAPSLGPKTILSAWLYRATLYTAADALKARRRRQAREQEAHMQSILNEPDTDTWAQLAPLLDDAMADLGETDRAALVLRYFENKSVGEIAGALRVNESAAQRRVLRAVEKLRSWFTKRGVIVPAVVLTTAISAYSVQAVPAGLAAAISATVVKGTAVAASVATLVNGTIKTIIMTTIQKTLIAVTLVAAVGSGIYEAREASTLRRQVQALQQQQAPLAEQNQQLQSERDDTSNRLAKLLAENSRAKPPTNQIELMKLRGEVARLRNDAKELAQLKANKAQAAAELFDLSMVQLQHSMTNQAVQRVAKMKAKLGLSDAQAEAIQSALFLKAEMMVQIYRAGRNGSLSGQEQHDQFKKLFDEVDQSIIASLDQNQLTAYEQMEKDAEVEFARSYGQAEANYIKRICILSPTQTKAAAKIIAGLPRDEGGPGSDSEGPTASNAKEQLEARIHALESVLTPEQLQAYRQARSEEIETAQAALRAVEKDK